MSTASPLHHGHSNGTYSTNSPAPTGMTGRDGGVTAAAVADSAVRSGSVPASASGSAPGSASGSMYGEGHAHHTAAQHHHSGHHTHSHGAMASPVNGGHSSSWSPYGYPSAPVYGGSPSPYGHNAYSQYASAYGYANGTTHHIATAPTTPAANGTTYHAGVNGMMMHHGQHAGYGYGSHHLGSHTPTHTHSHSSAYFMNGDGSHSHLTGSTHVSSPSYTSAPQYSTQLPLAGRHRVTTTLWEDEGTLCFQVDARGVCVARRHDNNMINGTKLLNVCGMSRGKRDGILKNEKERIVVKVGAMHLKGVWISFARAKQLAEQNGIADALYPLFEPNIQSFLYHPDNYPRTAAVIAAAQERQAQRQRAPGLPSPGATGNSQAPPLTRANTTPSNGDTSGFGSGLSSSTSWAGSHDQGHASAPTTTQPSPSSMQNGAAQMHMSLSSHGTSSPTYSRQQQPHQQQQYPMTAAQQLARPPVGDRRHSTPITLNNVNGHAENSYSAANLGGATANGGSLVNGARKVSGLKRSWNDADDLHGSATGSPSDRDMQRSGSGASNGYKLEGDNSHSPDTSDDRLAKKNKAMPNQRGSAMPSMSGNMLMGVGNGNGLHHE
ncbi:related to ascospore maturation 1 protein [Melanopsichium pennsylvanicum]|uniref:Related to ascospore maturation 1 protein n=2 Tax=Melanopsichium pennsylvanicum TaxID=63383 RepID=A0AAJ4XLE0_9BASI|nr:related to ascospore maturation 1 protein [Melanopsichium pennsylvanicum 4]SNX83228.1 related to ascospore maturation 1 protein [Melanopsichium pennsylvanicum]